MGDYCSGVPSGDGSGQRCLTALQSVLQGGACKRPDDPFSQPTRSITDEFLP
jgi:hypothetical protein